MSGGAPKHDDGGAAVFGCGNRPTGPIHFASQLSGRGVSALCYDRPRAIPWGRASWTLSDRHVTCAKCRARRRSAQQDGGAKA